VNDLSEFLNQQPPSESILDDVIQTSPTNVILLAILDILEENSRLLAEIRDELKAQGVAL